MVKRTFKDILIQDISNVFINQNEFAEELIIDGKPVPVVLDGDSLKDFKLKNGGEGLASSELLFYVKKSDLEHEPFIGKGIKIDNKRYRITDIQENLGVYTITIGVPTS